MRFFTRSGSLKGNYLKAHWFRSVAQKRGIPDQFKFQLPSSFFQEQKYADLISQHIILLLCIDLTNSF